MPVKRKAANFVPPELPPELSAIGTDPGPQDLKLCAAIIDVATDIRDQSYRDGEPAWWYQVLCSSRSRVHHHGNELDKPDLPEWAYKWAIRKLALAGLVSWTREPRTSRGEPLGEQLKIRAEPRLLDLLAQNTLASSLGGIDPEPGMTLAAFAGQSPRPGPPRAPLGARRPSLAKMLTASGPVSVPANLPEQNGRADAGLSAPLKVAEWRKVLYATKDEIGDMLSKLKARGLANDISRERWQVKLSTLDSEQLHRYRALAEKDLS